MKRLLLLLAFLPLASIFSSAQFNMNIGGLSFTSSGSVPGSCAVDGSKFFKNSPTEGWYTCISGGFVADAAAGSAFTGGSGASFQDVGTIANPANPAVNFIRLFASSTTGQLSCLTSAGGNCLAAAGVAGTNGQIEYNNNGSFGGFTMSGDATIVASTGVITVTKTGGVAFAASATTDTTNAANISSGTLPAGRLPNPSASTLGGIQSIASVSHVFLNAISTLGVPSGVQPACADLSTAGGGCSMSTTAGGDLSGTLPSPTVAKINGNSVPSGAVADQALIATAANTFGLTTIPNCTGGACALSYATSTHSYSALTNVITGSLTSTRVPFSNGANSLTDSANLTYAAGSGFTQVQGANGTDAHYIKRFTDTAPTGNFLRFQDAAALNDLFKVDASGNATATSYSSTNPSGNAGMLSLIQGTAPSAVSNAVNIQAPTSVTTYTLTLPGAAAAGFWNQTAGGTISFGTLAGDASSSGLTVTVVKVNGVAYPSGPSTDAIPTVTAANNVVYEQVNGGVSCGDSSHAISYSTSTHQFGCQSITGSAAAGGSNTQVQFNSGGALAGSANLTWVSPVLTIGASGVTGQLSIAGSTSGNTTLQAAATASGALTLPAATDTLIGKATTDTLTNKTYDTAGTGNVFKANGSQGTTGQLLRATTSASPQYIDYPDVKVIPAANCNNTSAGASWSIGSGGTVTCRAGTNNLGGYIAITDTSSTFATFQVAIPEDWDTGSNPYIRFGLASTDATNGHTIIPSIQVACYKGDGSTTDDVAANAAHSLSTVTLNGNANRYWSTANVQMNSTDMTGCVAGALMQVTVGRATDTATNAEFYNATITFPRLLAVQAN